MVSLRHLAYLSALRVFLKNFKARFDLTPDVPKKPNLSIFISLTLKSGMWYSILMMERCLGLAMQITKLRFILSFTPAK